MEVIKKIHHNDIERIVMVIKFLRKNIGNSFNRKQIGDGLWEMYIFPEGKTIHQIYQEVSSVISMHMGNPGNKEYTRKYPLKILQHNTHPLTWEYLVDSDVISLQPIPNKISVDEKVQNLQLKLDIECFTCEEIPKIDTNVTLSNEIIDVFEDSFKQEQEQEQAILLEDIKASDIISKTNDKEAFLIHWLDTTDDKPGAISQIIKIIAEYA